MNEINKKLLELVKENPELEIVPATHYEVCAGDDYPYWFGKIQKVDVDLLWWDDEVVRIGEDDILEQLEYLNHDAKEFEHMADEDFSYHIEHVVLKELIDKGEVKKAIIIWINV